MGKEILYGPSHEVNLAKSAGDFAQRAFVCHERGDVEGFAVYAATAVELLAKALLAKVNLLLIASGEKSLLILAMSDPRKGLPASSRTIGIGDCLRRLKGIGVRLDHADELASLSRVRNSILHSGQCDPDAIGDSLLKVWVRSLVQMTEHAGFDKRMIFGTKAEMAEVLITEYDSQVAALLAEKMAGARSRWDSEQEDLDASDIAIMREVLGTRLAVNNSADPTVQWIACPVCDLPACLFGEFEPEADFDMVDGEYCAVGIYHEFVPIQFICQTCRLDLDSRELIERSGILEEWEVSDDDLRRWDQIVADEHRWDHEGWRDEY